MQPASIGRIVHVIVDPATNNGSDVAPAMIVRAFGDPYVHDGLECQTVNVRIIADSREVPWSTSIRLFSERPTPEQIETLSSINPKGYGAVAFWPPRV